MRRHVATCIGCGCDDDHACWDDAQDAPCSWARVDYAAGLGVCSACPELVSAWDAGDREIRVPAEPRLAHDTAGVDGDAVRIVPAMSAGRGRSAARKHPRDDPARGERDGNP